jgi:hypothetical protein
VFNVAAALAANFVRTEGGKFTAVNATRRGFARTAAAVLSAATALADASASTANRGFTAASATGRGYVRTAPGAPNVANALAPFACTAGGNFVAAIVLVIIER